MTRESAKTEAEPSSQIENNQTADSVCTSWIKELHPNLDDRNIIENNEMLTDKIIDAAHQLLLRQCSINEIDTSLLCQASGFTPTQYPSVQIHHDPQRQHWITSSTVRQRVEVADSLSNGTLSSRQSQQWIAQSTDSLSNGTLSRSIQDQLNQKYSCLAVDGILPVRQQDNSVDCGVYAIANAIEFVVDNGNPIANYDIAVMRSHLIQCIESWELHPFPKCPPKIRGRQPKIKVYNITL